MVDLSTQRLILRPLARAEIDLIAALAGDKRIAEMTRSIPHPLTAADVAEWVDSLDRRHERAFAIHLRGDDESSEPTLIGVIALTVPTDSGAAEVGYWLGVQHWGGGYMTEALRRVLRYAFGDLKLTSVMADVFVENARSVGVLVKSGFNVEGRKMRPAPARGGDREVLTFRATRASFARAALSQAVGRE
ncbi:MAG TPA: GNAT family N-acetyltransferase [Alphaproteobacteria bacterium]|nr:GNAT family N-acetyltransferase [Alphaproteobacteria bacterium]